VEKCKSAFIKLCREAFTPRIIPLPGKVARFIFGGLYSTTTLHRALNWHLGSEPFLGGSQAGNAGSQTKVAILTTYNEGNRAMLVANYNRRSEKQTMQTQRGRRDFGYAFWRASHRSGELSTWQVAAAASATPPCFRAFYHDSSNRFFLDGGLYLNNPAKVVESERKLLWQDVSTRAPDIFLSIGTSQYKRHVDKEMDSESRSAIEYVMFYQFTLNRIISLFDVSS
jgi:hypothetical protein